MAHQALPTLLSGPCTAGACLSSPFCTGLNCLTRACTSLFGIVPVGEQDLNSEHKSCTAFSAGVKPIAVFLKDPRGPELLTNTHTMVILHGLTFLVTHRLHRCGTCPREFMSILEDAQTNPNPRSPYLGCLSGPRSRWESRTKEKLSLAKKRVASQRNSKYIPSLCHQTWYRIGFGLKAKHEAKTAENGKLPTARHVEETMVQEWRNMEK